MQNSKNKKIREIFFEISERDKKTGWGKKIHISQFKGKIDLTNNGVQWIRPNSGPEKIMAWPEIGKGNRKVWFQAQGFWKINKEDRPISSKILNIIKKKRCVITLLKPSRENKIECDHKNGRYNDERVKNLATQIINDFQPLHESMNKKKREACKKCTDSGIRFDAKEFGYKKSYTKGNEKHDGTINGCVGCFWFDVLEFRSNL